MNWVKFLGDKIEFPHNSQMYLKQALACVGQEKHEKALEYIAKAYELDKRNHINHFYTITLSTLERYEEALEIANEQKSFYLGSEQDALLYTMLLIKNNQFLEAEHLIQQNNLQLDSLLDQEWGNLKKELNLKRELVNFEIEMRKKTTKSRLTDIGQYTPMEQSEIIQHAMDLDLSDLQSFASMIFSNPFISGQIQRSYLEVLIEKNDTNNYSFSWFNQSKLISPNELFLFRETPTVQKIDEILEDKLHKYPSLFEIVKNEVINDLLLLYPFIEETITDLNFWINCYIEQFDYSKELALDTAPVDPEQEEMKRWIENLNVIAQRNLTREQ